MTTIDSHRDARKPKVMESFSHKTFNISEWILVWYEWVEVLMYLMIFTLYYWRHVTVKNLCDWANMDHSEYLFLSSGRPEHWMTVLIYINRTLVGLFFFFTCSSTSMLYFCFICKSYDLLASRWLWLEFFLVTTFVWIFKKCIVSC